MSEKFATNLVHPKSCFFILEQFCMWGALVGQVLHNSDAMLENDSFQTTFHSEC